MAVIKVPKTPKRAFNPGRPPSGLLRAQVEHLEAAARSVQGDLRPRKVRTEGQAALYIQQLTAQLYPHDVPVPEPEGSEPAGPRAIAGPVVRPRRPRKTGRVKTSGRGAAPGKAAKAAKKKTVKPGKPVKAVKAARKGANRGAAARARKRKAR